MNINMQYARFSKTIHKCTFSSCIMHNSYGALQTLQCSLLQKFVAAQPIGEACMWNTPNKVMAYKMNECMCISFRWKFINTVHTCFDSFSGFVNSMMHTCTMYNVHELYPFVGLGRFQWIVIEQIATLYYLKNDAYSVIERKFLCMNSSSLFLMFQNYFGTNRM